MKVLIVGGANIDITATTNDKYIPKDSNVGKVSLTFGGVGRNLSQSVALLGGKVSFLSAFFADPFTGALIRDLEDRGIDTSLSFFGAPAPSYYVSVNDCGGEMISAVSQMDGIDHISADYLKGALKDKAFDLLAFDCNLQPGAISYLLSGKEPTFCDGVSSTKVLRLKEGLSTGGRLFLLKVNKVEAQSLVGYDIKDKKSLFTALDHISSMGVENVYITLGRHGVGYLTEGKKGYYTAPKADVKNVSGGGDSFISGLIGALLHKKPMDSWVLYGLAASKLAIESMGAATDNLSFNAIEELASKIKKEVQYE